METFLKLVAAEKMEFHFLFFCIQLIFMLDNVKVALVSIGALSRVMQCSGYKNHRHYC